MQCICGKCAFLMDMPESPVRPTCPLCGSYYWLTIPQTIARIYRMLNESRPDYIPISRPASDAAPSAKGSAPEEP